MNLPRNLRKRDLAEDLFREGALCFEGQGVSTADTIGIVGTVGGGGGGGVEGCLAEGVDCGEGVEVDAEGCAEGVDGWRAGVKVGEGTLEGHAGWWRVLGLHGVGERVL